MDLYALSGAWAVRSQRNALGFLYFRKPRPRLDLKLAGLFVNVKGASNPANSFSS